MQLVLLLLSSLLQQICLGAVHSDNRDEARKRAVLPIVAFPEKVKAELNGVAELR